MKVLFIVLWILAAGALHLFGNNAGTFAILLTSIVVPVLCGAMVLIVSPNVLGLKLEASAELQSYNISCSRLAYLFKITCTFVCENTFTGQIDTADILVSRGLSSLIVEANHCGVLHISATNFKISDPFGLFSKGIGTYLSHNFVVNPKAHGVDIPAVNMTVSPESDEFSTTKAGMDVSEIFAIREYQPGDSIRSIHWKLSEKIDKTMVREFGLPISSSILLVFGEAEGEVSYDGWHTSGEMFFSTALAFAENNATVTMAWQTKDGVYEYPLRSPDDAYIGILEFFRTVTKVNVKVDYGNQIAITVIPGNTPRLVTQ